ncbi:carboxypeptidase-like regulatory domain-containing protein [Flavobacterium sp.]|uniref:TonB-dependent receptor n=1 Tax=Flavobacterium sp. TaxID=239 RepID=UPI0024879EC6|nr:carboxypeptidase-like regulatory domain-containing protein [Flavobacterium sp.]MDI1317316.1 carboxypeptidase-like regulatory domain-containing protein [Flavobacterium sp.]
MKTFYTFTLLVLSVICNAQQSVSGIVVTEKNVPIAGANVYIDGTYDGATTDESGNFNFTTDTSGSQTLVVTSLTFETSKIPIDVANCKNQTFKLKASENTLDAVVITAGNFSAGDKSRVSVLKPLDIVTTAGSAGNIIAALQTLPGTQNVGEDGRLFVRGGEADETQTFVDGIRVAQPYGATTNNLPTRGRFSPFLFSGISFSTGGYSAEYGEALSSVLLLNTQDEPDQNKTEISFMTVGLGLSNTQKWKKSSLSVNTAYIDLAPYQVAIPQNVDWNRAFQSLSGEAVYRYNFQNGIFKAYAAFDASRFDLNQEDINQPQKIRVNLNNNNFYLNTSYRGTFAGNWQVFTGLSYGYGQNKINIDVNDINNTEHASHLKFKITKKISNRIKLNFGTDYFSTKFDERFNTNFKSGYESSIAAVYTEADITFSNDFAIRLGVRGSTNDYISEKSISPRASLAYKISKKSQFSFAYGNFEQAPRQEYLKYSDDFKTEKSAHYILNYQYVKHSTTFRAEVYYKGYSDLVKYDTNSVLPNSVFSNNGEGFAKGVDLFWRDGNSIKNLEYWVSYSFIDTKRDYQNFSSEVTPSFVASNSLSLVTKYWISDWKSQVGFTHQFSSGRPYNNPNETAFMNGKTKSFNNLSFNWAYLVTQQKILYFSVSNVLGTQNIFGYNYATTPNGNGIYDRKAVIPTADRFFFVGFFWTISENKKDNQLKNL